MTDASADPQPVLRGGPPPLPATRTDGSAVVALVLAIASWVVLPVILSIAALVVASSAHSAIAASGGATSGDGLVKASKVVAWLNLIFWGLVIIFGVAFLIGLAIGN